MIIWLTQLNIRTASTTTSIIIYSKANRPQKAFFLRLKIHLFFYSWLSCTTIVIETAVSDKERKLHYRKLHHRLPIQDIINWCLFQKYCTFTKLHAVKDRDKTQMRVVYGDKSGHRAWWGCSASNLTIIVNRGKLGLTTSIHHHRIPLSSF